MKTRYITLGGIVVVILVAFYLIGGMVLSKVAVVGVEAFVPQVTKTSVNLDSLKVSPLTGSGTLKGFVLGNPEGYQSGHSIAFDMAHMDVAPFSIMGDRILIEKIHIYGPKFNYERKLLTSNIKEILKNVQAAAGRTGEDGGTPEVPEEKATPSEIKIEIKELIIDEGQVAMTVAGTTVPLPLPKIVLRDLGTDEGGVSPDEMAFEIMSVVLNQVLVAVAKNPGATVDGIKNLFGGKKEG